MAQSKSNQSSIRSDISTTSNQSIGPTRSGFIDPITGQPRTLQRRTASGKYRASRRSKTMDINTTPNGIHQTTGVMGEALKKLKPITDNNDTSTSIQGTPKARQLGNNRRTISETAIVTNEIIESPISSNTSSIKNVRKEAARPAATLASRITTMDVKEQTQMFNQSSPFKRNEKKTQSSFTSSPTINIEMQVKNLTSPKSPISNESSLVLESDFVKKLREEKKKQDQQEKEKSSFNIETAKEELARTSPVNSPRNLSIASTIKDVQDSQNKLKSISSRTSSPSMSRKNIQKIEVDNNKISTTPEIEQTTEVWEKQIRNEARRFYQIKGREPMVFKNSLSPNVNNAISASSDGSSRPGSRSSISSHSNNKESSNSQMSSNNIRTRRKDSDLSLPSTTGSDSFPADVSNSTRRRRSRKSSRKSLTTAIPQVMSNDKQPTIFDENENVFPSNPESQVDVQNETDKNMTIKPVSFKISTNSRSQSTNSISTDMMKSSSTIVTSKDNEEYQIKTTGKPPLNKDSSLRQHQNNSAEGSITPRSTRRRSGSIRYRRSLTTEVPQQSIKSSVADTNSYEKTLARIGQISSDRTERFRKISQDLIIDHTPEKLTHTFEPNTTLTKSSNKDLNLFIKPATSLVDESAIISGRSSIERLPLPKSRKSSILADPKSSRPFNSSNLQINHVIDDITIPTSSSANLLNQAIIVTPDLTPPATANNNSRISTVQITTPTKKPNSQILRKSTSQGSNSESQEFFTPFATIDKQKENRKISEADTPNNFYTPAWTYSKTTSYSNSNEETPIRHSSKSSIKPNKEIQGSISLTGSNNECKLSNTQQVLPTDLKPRTRRRQRRFDSERSKTTIIENIPSATDIFDYIQQTNGNVDKENIQKMSEVNKISLSRNNSMDSNAKKTLSISSKDNSSSKENINIYGERGQKSNKNLTNKSNNYVSNNRLDKTKTTQLQPLVANKRERRNRDYRPKTMTIILPSSFNNNNFNDEDSNSSEDLDINIDNNSVGSKSKIAYDKTVKKSIEKLKNGVSLLDQFNRIAVSDKKDMMENVKLDSRDNRGQEKTNRSKRSKSTVSRLPIRTNNDRNRSERSEKLLETKSNFISTTFVQKERGSQDSSRTRGNSLRKENSPKDSEKARQRMQKRAQEKRFHEAIKIGDTLRVWRSLKI